MKTYQKPALLALSLSANDKLCNGCSAQTRFDSALNSFLIDFFGDNDSDGIFEYEDAMAKGLFDDGSCANQFEYEGYCKFTGADDQILFTS